MAANRFLVFVALPVSVCGNLVIESATRNEFGVSRNDYYTDDRWLFGAAVKSCKNYTCADSDAVPIVDMRGDDDCLDTGCSDAICCFNVAYGPTRGPTPKCKDSHENIIERYPYPYEEADCRERCTAIGDACKYYQRANGFCTLYKTYCTKDVATVIKKRTCDDVVNATGNYPDCQCGKSMLGNQQILWCGKYEVGDKTSTFNMNEVGVECNGREQMVCNANEVMNALKSIGSGLVKGATGAAAGAVALAKKAGAAAGAAATAKYKAYKDKQAARKQSDKQANKV